MSDNRDRFGNWQDEMGNAVEDLTISAQPARLDAHLPHQAAANNDTNTLRPPSSSSSLQLHRINATSGRTRAARHAPYAAHRDERRQRLRGGVRAAQVGVPEMVAEPPLRPLGPNPDPNGADTLTMEVHFSGWNTPAAEGDGTAFLANDERGRAPTECENLQDRLAEAGNVVPDIVVPLRQPRMDLDADAYDGFVIVGRTANEDDVLN
ncbi:unnamed protein product, partial [Mesorhabditis spiculigera]